MRWSPASTSATPAGAAPSWHAAAHSQKRLPVREIIPHRVTLSNYRFRWFAGAPLRDGQDAMLVNWIGVTVTDAKGQVTYSSAFVTSLPVTRDTVAEIVACARARWKIENESFNV